MKTKKTYYVPMFSMLNFCNDIILASGLGLKPIETTEDQFWDWW